MQGQPHKRNPRRAGIPASKNGVPNESYQSIDIHGTPTSERLKRTEGHFTLGGEDRGIRTYVIRDAPIDRALKRGMITGAEHSALQKYYLHWFRAGQSPSISSLDLDRIFAGGESGPPGMPKSEGQVFHRQRWREARNLLGPKTGTVVDNVVCSEMTLEVAGYSLSYRSPFRAREGALSHIRLAGDILRRHWGIG